MNGFIYSQTSGETCSPDLAMVTSLFGPQTAKRESLPGGEALVEWGSDSGDIQVSRNGVISAMVLCGYVSEVDSGPAISNQAQAATFLRECLDRDFSATSLKSLLDRMHGSFSVMYRDFRKGVLLCLSDRTASRPLWRMRAGNGWIVSSHPVAIAAAGRPLNLDLGALGAFLLYGGPVQPLKSLFAGVTAMPPGSILQLGNGGSVVHTTWYRFHHQADESRSISYWVENAADRLVRSAGRIVAQCKEPVVFLSGGVDSRLATVALKAAGAEPLLVTLGDARNLEVRVSEQAAKAMKLPHAVILRDKHWYLRELPRLVLETGGSLLWTHGHFSQAVRNLGDDFSRRVFMLGDFCEAFSKLLCRPEPNRQRVWTPEEFRSSFDQIRLSSYQPGNRVGTLSLLRPEIRGRVENALAEDILASYRNVADCSADPWIVGDQCFRWWTAATAPTFFMFQDLRSAAAERNLMFDKDIHRLLEILPSRVRQDANFGARLIRKLDPAASRVVNANSLIPLSWPPAVHKLSRKCKPVLGKVRRLLIGHTHRTTGAWPEKAALYGSDPEWCGYVGKVLDGDQSFSGSVFDEGRVRACWTRLKSGDREVAPDIEKLLQLGVLAGLGVLDITSDR